LVNWIFQWWVGPSYLNWVIWECTIDVLTHNSISILPPRCVPRILKNVISKIIIANN
jgi:hypothetical protein